ncbi:MAG: hypothetical protein CME63_02920 [Halobacteriovoraceae bacterium]|nr:hypothetical protein [Halobacteriovoraceae bacterium]|tara:strand:+ start:8982 stop:9416 length:435 start_codon:yes stop_codon:yes gene_type:complete
MRLTIGKLAKAAEVGVETIRFYERKGLLIQPEKVGGFRYYSSDLVTKIRFIKRSQQLGFTLSETKELLELSVQSTSQCKDILLKTEHKIREIDEKMKDLKRMKDSLSSLANCCEDKTIPLSECPILDCFFEEKCDVEKIKVSEK